MAPGHGVNTWHVGNRRPYDRATLGCKVRLGSDSNLRYHAPECIFPHYIPFQIKNHLNSALDDLDGTTNAVGKAKNHQPFVESELTELKAECEALGWDKITTVRIIGR